MTIEAKIESALAAVKARDTEVEALTAKMAEMQDALAAAKSAPTVEVKDEATEMRAKFFEAIAHGDGTANQAMIEDGKIKSAFVVGTATSAGAGIVKEVSGSVVKRLQDAYVVAKLFGSTTVSSTDHEKLVQIGHSICSWQGENVDVNGIPMTATPTFGKVKLSVGKLSAAPVISIETISDNLAFNAEKFLMEDVADQMARGLALGVLNGSGTGSQPRGFYKGFDKSEGVKDQATRQLDMYKVVAPTIADDVQLIEELRKLPFALPAAYALGGKYVMSRSLFERLCGCVDGQGRYYLHESVEQGVAGTLFGYPVIVDPMNVGDTVQCVFGHLDKAFHIADIPTAYTVLRNAYAIPHAVRYDVLARVGTIVNDNAAVVGMMATINGRSARSK
ncbi:phage major capsid protein [Edwardsiella tarda]|uniref:phage major capsid protein n=1 Tax=Edwardsiella tarda TaxID=636 RepID=UPI00083A194A|nr:phage major capsid protein [Edwardsiella tarda]